MSLQAAFAHPVAVSVATLIENDPVLNMLLKGGKVYNGLAPKDSLLPYITFNEMVETPQSAFMVPGSLTTLTMNCWGQGPRAAMGVLEIYTRLVALLGRQRIPVAGGNVALGVVRLVQSGPGDPSDASVYRSVVAYDVQIFADRGA